MVIAQILTIGIVTNRKPKVNDEEKDVNLAVLLSMLENEKVEYNQEQIQRRLDSIVGENKVEVSKALIGLKVKFLETGNTYKTINAQSNLKAIVIKQKINKVLKYVLEAILIMNLIIAIVLIYKNKCDIKGKLETGEK